MKIYEKQSSFKLLSFNSNLKKTKRGKYALTSFNIKKRKKHFDKRPTKRTFIRAKKGA